MITPKRLALLSIVMFFLFLIGSGISAASTKEGTAKGLSWLMLLLNRATANNTVTLVTPYVHDSDMKYIRSGFSSDKNSSPWGYVHDGFDMYPKEDLKPFQAVCSGRAQLVHTFDEQVTVMLACNSTYTVEYDFETQSPDTGDEQLANITVVEGQAVLQGDIIGYLYAQNESAHVHVTLYKNWIPSCPEVYFSQEAGNSMLKLLHVTFPNADLCYGGDVAPPPLVTPYANESDMTEIQAAFSSDNSSPPWGFVHDGIDMSPQGDLKSFQAACSGTVDSVDLRQAGAESNWQVEVLIQCDDYVDDPDMGRYFIPFSVVYFFEPMSNKLADGATQLTNVIVAKDDTVSQGDIIGSLHVAGEGAHVQFGLEMFGSSFFSALGVTGIPLCPEPHFSTTAKDSILNLLHVVWPSATMCYQN